VTQNVAVTKWVLNEESSQPIIKKALELGINFFDTANVYASGTSEEILGHGLKDFANRDEVVIAPPRCTAKCATGRMAPGYRARRS
jgi:aryl-alcohol dehydrogenase-like predicted oxidoreductase